MKYLAAALTAIALGAALGLHASFQTGGRVEVVRLDGSNWDETAPRGKEVDAIYGDVVLRNDHLVAVIAQPVDGRNANMTVRDVAGCLIDLTVRDRQSDQLSAFYPGARRYPYREMRITPAAGDASGVASVTVIAAAGQDRPAVEVTYALEPDARFLTVTTTYTNESQGMLAVPLEDDLRADGQKDDIVRTPNGTTDLFWFHDQYWGQAYGIEAVGLKTVVNSNTRTSTLKYESKTAGASVMLAAGQSFELVRRVFPGVDLPQVRAIAAGIGGETSREVALTVTDGAGRPVPSARVALSKGESAWGMTATGDDGIARTWLPAGAYSVTVAALGVDITPAGDAARLDVAAGGDRWSASIVCPQWKPGTVNVHVTDAAGDAIPCKIEFVPRGDAPAPWFGPETADFGVKSLCYAAQGKLSRTVPPGTYDVWISHGPEYDAAWPEVVVPPGGTVELRQSLARVVDTSGWISSDFHSHSSPSGDNTGSQLGRVLNLLCDHIEFAPCTEHNRVDTYQPHIDMLDAARFISSCSGMELTGSPLPLNHQNAFPMTYRPHIQDGGGPVTDADIETQVERLALWDNRSEKLVQINHPDLGWLLRDRNGDGEPDEGHARILPHLDVIEIHPITSVLKLNPQRADSSTPMNDRIFNWLQFQNQGQRFVGVVNTDAHYNYHESGWLRNWIRSPTDVPPEIRPLDVVRAAEAGAVVMSNGPFLKVAMHEAGRSAVAIAGQDLEAPSGRVVVDVSVQAPNWFDVDRVFLLVNGRVHSVHNYRRETHPDRFRSGVVKFAEKLELTLEHDAHVIVACGAENSTLGQVHGPTWGKHHPAALINPVYVDVDGNGFASNGDTLDAPLPVKAGTAKP